METSRNRRNDVVRAAASRLALACVLSFAAPLLVPESPAAAYAQAGETVVEIRFEGNRLYSPETLKLALRTKEGQKLDRALLAEDVAALYEFFATVDPRQDQLAEGVRLVFVVTENPPVTEVVVLGTDGLSASEVRDVVETSAGRPLAESPSSASRTTSGRWSASTAGRATTSSR
jgi:outer membrane protein assembly factor BamA